MSIQRSVDVGAIVRDAAVFKFGENGHVNEAALMDAVEHLFDLLTERQIDFVLVGGIALLQYVDGHNTKDIDVILALSDLDRLPEIQISELSECFAQGWLGPLKIDFLLTRNQLFDHVRQNHVTTKPFSGREIPCVTVKGLLLLKLYALSSLYHQGNFDRIAIYESDILQLLQRYQQNDGKNHDLLDELRKYMLSSDVEAIGEVLDDIQRRIERIRRGM